MKHSALALGLLAGTLAPPLHAAVTLSDAFSGNWRDADRPNRGWDIDVLTRNDGSKVLFLYSATYDAAGKPFWITSNFEINEFEHAWTAKAFGTYEGGSFGG
jgi:hypothetical protein